MTLFNMAIIVFADHPPSIPRVSAGARPRFLARTSFTGPQMRQTAR